MISERDYQVLRATNDMLVEENRQLRDQLYGEGLEFPQDLKLTRSERKVLRCLMARTMATRDALYTSIYGDVPEADQPEFKIVDVWICKIRRKLRALDVAVESVWGQGYRITAEDKEKLRPERVSAE